VIAVTVGATCPNRDTGLPHDVTERGDRREAIFFEDGDHEIYLELLAVTPGPQVRGTGGTLGGPKLIIYSFRKVFAGSIAAMRRVGTAVAMAVTIASTRTTVTIVVAS
jgi:hypothetical protein